MSRITGSRIDLAMECLHSFTLALPRDHSGPAAQLGTEFHAAALSTGRNNPLDADGEATLAEMLPTWQKNGKKLLPFSRRVEVAYAISPDGDVKELGENIGRRYDQHGAGPNDLCLSLDVVSDERIVDLKTGKKKFPAAEAWQLRAGVAAALPNGGAAEFHYVAKNGRTTVDTAKFTADDSSRFRLQLASLASRLRDGDTAPNPGEHCTELWCQARKICKAYQQSIGHGHIIEQQQRQQQAQQEKQMGTRMSLENVKGGTIEAPYRILMYGIEGVGKTKFAADSSSPVFISSERGTEHVNVQRFPEPKSWSDVFDAITSLHGDHAHQTLVVDTIDWLEPLCFAHVCAEKGWESVDKPAYGAGYNAAREEWRRLLDELVKLQDAKSMGVILLAHANVRKHKHPELDEFDRFELSLNRASAKLIREWSTDVLFADYETLTYKEGQRTRAIGEGARYIHTNWRPAFDAKNRRNLPDKLPLSWDDFDAACRGTGRVADVKTEIADLLTAADPDLRSKVETAMKGADAVKLSQILNKLKAKLAA